MTKKKPPTKFAPAERVSAQEIKRQARLFTSEKLLGVLPDAVPCILLVVNAQRQLVFANERFIELLPTEQRGIDVLGRRPGEALGCVHADEAEGGCGTTEFCGTCGAVHAILTSQSGTADVQECRITRTNGEAMDFRVWTTPVTMDGETFTIFAALDICDEKRRHALEHIFLHDINNVAYGLSWYADFFQNAGAEKIEEYADAIRRLSRELIEEIDTQRILIKAEAGELTLTPEPVSSLQLLRDAVALYSRHPASHDRRLRVDDQSMDAQVVTDRVLLSRVLCNMVKNALEASRAGQTVTVGCTTTDDTIELWVHNPGSIPREVQLQIFQRSFSTKGRGRGLGTYSIRLLSERYLKATASFTSTPEHGTTFRVRCPAILEA